MLLLGVTGSIAAYKAADLASKLHQKNIPIQVIMSKSATEFVAPLTFEALTGNKVITDQNYFDNSMVHIEMTDKAKLFLIAPATANCIAKLAHGLADDLIGATSLAIDSPMWLAPAMNTRMWEHPATCENLDKIKTRDKIKIIEPESGSLACGHKGNGRMASVDSLADMVLDFFNQK